MNASKLSFHHSFSRRVEASFDAATISSDCGALFLREIESHCGIIGRFADAFSDHRNRSRTRHDITSMLTQRVLALACGYEDLADHADLRRDPLHQLLTGHVPGTALASPATLNRLEFAAAEGSPNHRYKKITLDEEAAADCFIDHWLAARPRPAKDEILILDLDATDIPLHGAQEGRHFHGYYDTFCYLPLYVFEGEHLLAAVLRPSNIDASAGAEELIARIVAKIRTRWPAARILVRGDSGFCREGLMACCEELKIAYLLGLARNSRLVEMIVGPAAEAAAEFERTGSAARRFADLSYQTLKSWSRARRVVAKAEHLARGPNPRFVVTSLSAAEYDARSLYEDLYCARGEMENRIKESQLYLYADRTSSRSFRANQLRLWLSGLAYVLMQTLREVGLAGTELARAQCDTIRLKLVKIGGSVRASARRFWLSLSAGYPHQQLFATVLANLRLAFGYG